MKKALVFVTAFALVLVAGAALALIGSSSDLAEEEPAAIEEPTTTITGDHEKPLEEPAANEKLEEKPVDEPVDHKDHEEQPPADERNLETEEPKDTDPPDLVILHPEDGQHFEEKTIAFEGKTEIGARVFAGNYEADVDDHGNWRIVLILEEGGNTATIRATDKAGNESTARVKAYYDAPKEEAPVEEEKPKEEEPKHHEFSAHQKYRSCSENPPYDIWYGAGEPGTEIWVVAPGYGEGHTVIGDHGEWDLRVNFPESPCNKTIEVVLETNKGHRKVYEFTRICEESEGK